MAYPSELSLDCKPQSYSMLLKSFGDNFQSDVTTQKLEDFLSRLEEERLKIDAFKRELPLCMQLLTNAVEVYKQQLQAYRANGSNNHNHSARPVLEEFIPLRNSNTDNHEKTDNKEGWMASAQLWNQAATTNNAAETKPNITLSAKENTDITLNVAASPKLGFDAKQRNGGAFLPFSKEPTLPELALSNSADNTEIEDSNRVSESGKPIIEQNKGQNRNTNDAQNTINNNNNSSNTTQSHRKARRCWSPDLHRRFVQALQMLGGSQVATPKQIRELMKVDGLTNDEVKSHLQKYRLHTRRPSPSPQAPGVPAPHLVVLGGIWVPSEFATAAAATHGAPAIYHHHLATTAAPPPPHFCPQEFYTSPAAAAAPPPLPPPHHHHQIHSYKASPESPAGGESTAEDGKSESGEERKGFAGLKKEGEESNGSEITLKF